MKNVISPLDYTRFLIILCAILLSACGAGGKIADPPSAPNPSASAKNQEVIVEWENVDGASFYYVYWDDKPGVNKNSEKRVKADDSRVTINDLINDTTYYFVVSAVGEGNEGNISEEVHAMPIAIPIAPEQLHVTRSDKVINLSWQTVEGVTEYRVYIQREDGTTDGQSPRIVTDSEITIDDLDHGVPYNFIVKAVNSSGESSESKSILVELTPPVAPAEIEITRNDTIIDLRWNAVDQANEYHIYISSEDDDTISSDPIITTDLSLHLDNFKPGASYQFNVKAVNSSGQSLESSPINIELGPPLAPQVLSFSRFDTLVDLSWQVAEQAKKYHIYVSSEDDPSLSSDPIVTSEPVYHISTLLPNVIYKINVVGVNSTGEGASSNELEIKLTPPLAPGGLVFEKSDNVVDLDWQAAEQATQYHVAVFSNSDPTIGETPFVTTDLHYQLDMLQPMLTYRISVKATNSSGESQASNLIDVTLLPPDVPTSLTAKRMGSSIEFSWNPVDQANEYHVFLLSEDDISINLDANVTNTANLVLANFDQQSTYQFYVQAKNSNGFSLDSEIVEISPITVLKVESGAFHSCAIRSDHSLWCWGDNSTGAVGDKTTNNHVLPVQVGIDFDWAEVGAGTQYTCAVKLDGSLWCWGDNFHAQLGFATEDAILEPKLVELDHQVSILGISSQSQTTCEVEINGSLYCWGQNFFGQTGGNSDEPSLLPTLVGEAGEWESISAGPLHTCAVKKEGTLWCWGAGFFGQLGNDNFGGSTIPTGVDDLDNWVFPAVGPSSSCAINTQGKLWCWGDGSSGRLGNGAEDSEFSPVPVAEEESWLKVSSGGLGFSCAIHTNNSVWCWGDNSKGQFGNGNEINSNVPLQMDETYHWETISSGDSHVCGLTFDGEMYCWGGGDVGQLGVGDELDINSENAWINIPTLILFP